MASAVHCLLVCLVLLVSPYLGWSYHTSYTHGKRHYVLRSNRDPRQQKLTPTCSSAHSETGSSGALPVVHRLNPCSPLSAAARSQQQDKPSVADVLHRDALRLRSLFQSRMDNHGSSHAPAPAPTSPGSGGVSIPSHGIPTQELPGAFEYHVIAAFGTPLQEFAVGFDTSTTGATLLRCKPCVAGDGKQCDDAFDPSASSSLAQIPCGSPDCPLKGCSGPSCTLSISVNGTLLGNATFVTDTLTLTLFTIVDSFRFACLEAGIAPADSSAGILDLSRNSHSLPSRLPPRSPDAVAFSYCLPAYPWGDEGFLSFGATRPELQGRQVSYTPLRSDHGNGNLYLVELVGLALGAEDLPVPPAVVAAGDAVLELHTTFTYLNPRAYKVLRDRFREFMKGYPVTPPLVEKLDTCYNFTGLEGYAVPAVTLKFDGGAEVVLWLEEMMYFAEPGNVFSVGCLAFVPQEEDGDGTVIGSMAQMSTEVVYDVRGGKVGFVPNRC